MQMKPTTQFPRNRMRYAALPLAIFLGACSTMTPYQQPDVPFSERWIDASLNEQQSDARATALPRLCW